MLTAEAIARVCHEANRAYCRELRDESQPSWDDAPAWQKESAIAGVGRCLDDAAITSEQLHEAWSRDKLEAGWVFGMVKDPLAKTHPCLVPYGELPAEQRAKDALFGAICRALGPRP